MNSECEHEFEYLQSNRIDRSTKEDEYFCVKCGYMSYEYLEIPFDEWSEPSHE